MIETDKVIRICDSEESKRLDNLNRTGNYYYYYDIDGNYEYHYITVDDSDYRLKYLKVEQNKLKFTGEAVEIEESTSEFTDN